MCASCAISPWASALLEVKYTYLLTYLLTATLSQTHSHVVHSHIVGAYMDNTYRFTELIAPLDINHHQYYSFAGCWLLPRSQTPQPSNVVEHLFA
jgi:hypothetical protein